MDTSDLDQRRNAYRDDLAAEILRGKVARPATRRARRARWPIAPCRCAARPTRTRAGRLRRCSARSSPSTSEHDGWAWVQLAARRLRRLSAARPRCRAQVSAPTHRVRALGTFLYPRARHQSRRRWMPLSINAALRDGRGGTSVRQARRMAASCPPATSSSSTAHARLRRGRRALHRRALPLGRQDAARRRLLRAAAGRHAGRRHGLPTRQRHAAGGARQRASPISGELDGLRAAISCSGKATSASCRRFLLLHANAHHMAVAAEPLRVAADRIAGSGSVITAIKRLAPR